MKKIEIPSFLAHLSVDERGYPIPYFVAYFNGKPDFRLLDYQKREKCMTHHLCGVCGRELHRKYGYFISGPLGFKNHVHSDPPMHYDCALYSLQTCPHLYYEKADRRETGERYEEAAKNDIVGVKEKPSHFYLIQSDKWKWIEKTIDNQHVKIIKFRIRNYDVYKYSAGTLHSETNKKFYQP